MLSSFGLVIFEFGGDAVFTEGRGEGSRLCLLNGDGEAPYGRPEIGEGGGKS